MSLVACVGCQRHVRAGEACCPFCGAAVDAKPAPAPVVGRLGRAALFAFGATLSVAAVGCGEAHTPQRDSGTEQDAGAMPLYGGPPDSGAPQDAGGPAPAYGAAPIDAGGPAPAYGAAPIDGG